VEKNIHQLVQGGPRTPSCTGANPSTRASLTAGLQSSSQATPYAPLHMQHSCKPGPHTAQQRSQLPMRPYIMQGHRWQRALHSLDKTSMCVRGRASHVHARRSHIHARTSHIHVCRSHIRACRSHVHDAVRCLAPPVGAGMGHMAQDVSVSSRVAHLLCLDNVDKLQSRTAAKTAGTHQYLHWSILLSP
jgi:hypothetical protein